jgi:hypothetical protein
MTFSPQIPTTHRTWQHLNRQSQAYKSRRPSDMRPEPEADTAGADCTPKVCCYDLYLVLVQFEANLKGFLKARCYTAFMCKYKRTYPVRVTRYSVAAIFTSIAHHHCTRRTRSNNSAAFLYFCLTISKTIRLTKEMCYIQKYCYVSLKRLYEKAKLSLQQIVEAHRVVRHRGSHIF